MLRTTSAGLVTLGLAVVAAAASANPVSGTYFDTANNDNHGTQQAIWEIGTGSLFTPGFQIISSSVVTGLSSSPGDNININNFLVRMVNTTGQNWKNLFYVADPDTNISNDDGAAWSNAAPGAIGHAFRIDSIGINTPLVSESMNSDGVFQAGEIWEFIIQDYFNTNGFLAHDFSSLDFAGGSMMIPPTSSGSIIAFVPAPGSLALLGLGGLAAGRRRRAAH